MLYNHLKQSTVQHGAEGEGIKMVLAREKTGTYDIPEYFSFSGSMTTILPLIVIERK